MMSLRQTYFALSLIAEPGDPRLVAMLDVADPHRLLESILAGRQVGGTAVPAAWAERAARLDSLIASTLADANAAGLRWLCRSDRSWPESLNDLDHVAPINGVNGAPLVLWLRGKGSPRLLRQPAVSIVGARDATTYGAEVAAELASDVADADMTVVSGAAFGIDACAHRGALFMGKPTVAVLAGGADVDYPRPHASLLARIAIEGLIVSEQAPGQTPMKARFLSRNRIIAALSQGTVVVEAARRSGSLNTLNWADQLGRLTMGIPGPVTSQASAGVHEAIRTGRSILVTRGADVVEALGGLGVTDASPERAPVTAYDRMSTAQQQALDAVPWAPPRTTDAIAAELRMASDEAHKQLARLETLGFVARVPTGWTLLRRADEV